MPLPANLISHKALDTYYAAIATYQTQDVAHEQATRLAFSTLLDTLSKTVGWTVVLEKTLSNRKRPDATLQDSFKIPRGYWEAKDTNDDLDVEIKAKIARGYPLTNIIFEDTRRAVLYQNGRPAFEADLKQRSQLVALLTKFLTYTGERIEEFHLAVQEFKERIPELARGLMARIEEERGQNKRFVTAFDVFQQICRSSIDPDISAQEIEEMLVQHLLTERLFRTVFNDSDFTRRNVIAAEIEKVIDALTSRSFNRGAFLKQLDYFYIAIEHTAQTIDDFAQKQTFLNTVYERFFQGFSKDQADTYGVVYTPQPIVDFMINSVDEVLQKEFGLSLSSEGVKILDPATGTGNFIVNILRKINRRDLKRKYREELFANEIMLLPYYIAALNIEHAYYDLTGEYEAFEGICFTDTLELADSQQLSLFAEENTERVQRQKNAEITVIIGNPPYNVGQVSENDNNKNRKYKIADQRVRETYAKQSRATNKNALSDVYVKFFRWAVDRLQGREGIVCYVSNNSFVDQLAFDGMRKQLAQDFDQIYHLDLHGNVRQNPKLSGTTHNVFGIQVGVGITIAVRKNAHSEKFIKYYRVPEDWRKTEKLIFLADKKSIADLVWQELQPDTKQTWLTEGMRADFDAFLPIGNKESKAQSGAEAEALFKTYSRGVATSRDTWAYDFNHTNLADKMQRFIETYNGEVDRWVRRSDRTVSVDDVVSYDDAKMKWSRDLKLDLQRGHHASFEDRKIRQSLYRPFCKQYLFFDRILNEEVYVFPSFFPTPASEAENRIIWLKVGSDWPMFALISNIIPDLLPQGGSQCFPFYTYAEDGSNQRENITDWALAQFQAQYGAQVTKRDIFHYVYGVLHSPQYREHYADNLKRELPRIPLTPALSHGEREPDSDLPWPLHGAREPDSDLPSPCGRGAGGEGNEPQPQKPPLPPALLQRCRELRQASTGAEQILWQLLRDRQFVGAKFRRQHPLRGYILDFYCHEARLAIELDGGGHADPAQAAHDAERTRALQAEGISVLRFWNNQVSQNTEGVLEEIWAALNSAHSPPLSHPENEPDSDLPAPGGRGAGGEGGFWHFVDTGARLADIHLNYEQAKEYKLKWIENKNVPFSWRVTKMQLSKDKTQLRVNESLTLTGIPAECFEYRLGNRSALDWVIDQYQISTDKRSGITSDPNRDDDEEYIVRLVGRVITVSMETVKLVKALPPVVVVEVGVP